MTRLKNFQHTLIRLIVTGLLAIPAITGQAQFSETPDGVSKGIFPKGEQGPSQNFTGKAWHYGLVPADSMFTSLVGNVYFEPGARTNWHMHPAGQILVITDGRGYHQIKGQLRQDLKKGDVIKCPPGVMHWHGASPMTGMQQLYIVPNTEKGIVEWMEPVTSEEYNHQN